ncbi:MAG TPA: Hsp70 family protein [Acidimicrobiales bacterium]|nr:Hsp70 family protein [Acidimicrobiales bacterium]
MGYALGLDLGTTFSGAAIARDGRAEMVALSHNASVIPSVLFLREDGTFLFGEAAARRGLQDPGRVAREFKRRFGDTTPLLLGGSPWSADGLSVQLLRHLTELVTAQEGGPPDAVTVTHPANWGPYKTDLLDQAVRAAGLVGARLLSEPEAAAVHYASAERMAAGEVVAIYDLGGGTFDAAALRRTGSGFELLGLAEGIERLGGIDFDEAVLAHVVSFVGPALADLDASDPAVLGALARLRAECVAAKEGLSDDTEVSVAVVLPSLQTQIRLTRSEFEDMIRPTLAETTSVLSRTLRSGGVEPEQVKAVLLVGGSSRIPLVGQLVAAEMGRPVAVDVHPKHAVALGAALHAAGVPEAAAPPEVPAAPTGARPPRPATVPPAAAAAPVVAPPAAAAVAPAPAPPAAPVAASPAVPAPADVGGAGRKRRLVAAGAAVAVVVVAAVAFVSLKGDGKPSRPTAKPEVPTFAVEDSVVSMASGAGSLWLAGPSGVTRFDPSTNQVKQAVRVGDVGDSRRVAFGAGAVWVTDQEASQLARIDPATNAVTDTIPLGGKPQDVLVTAGAVWVSLPDDGVVVRVDPTTDELTQVHVRGKPGYLAYGGGVLWVSDAANSTLARIDPVKLVVSGDAASGGCPNFVAADDASVWVQDECMTTMVFRVDPASGKVAGTATVGNNAKAVVLAGATLWVADANDNTVSKVDVATMATTRTVRVGLTPAAFAVEGSNVWVANAGDNTISRIDG